MSEIGHLVVVLGDVAKQLGHDRGVVVLERVPVELRIFLGKQHALEDAVMHTMGDVAVQLGIVAPQAQIVHRAADHLVPDQRVLGARFHRGVLAEDVDHVVAEREVGHAGVAGDFVAAVFLAVGHAHVRVAVDGAAVASIELDGVLLGFGAFVFGRFHRAVANGVELAGFRFAGFDGLAFCICPIQALARRPAGALVVVLGPFLLGRRHDVVVVRADDVAQHVVGQICHCLRIGHVHASVAFDNQRLELFRAENRAQAGARRVVARVDNARIGQQVFACWADGGHAGAGPLDAVERLGGRASAHAPDEACILDLHVVVFDADIHRAL